MACTSIILSTSSTKCKVAYHKLCGTELTVSHAQRRGRNTIMYAASIVPLFLEFHRSIASQRSRLVSYTGVLSPASSADADATNGSVETVSRPVSRLFAFIAVLKFCTRSMHRTAAPHLCDTKSHRNCVHTAPQPMPPSLPCMKLSPDGLCLI